MESADGEGTRGAREGGGLMGRIRSLKPEFYLSERVGSVSFGARLLFAGLWTIADREGRLRWQPKKIKAQLFPYDNIEIYPWAEELVTARLLQFYADEDGVYTFIPGFGEHQRPHPKEPASTIPPYPSVANHDWLPWKETALGRETPGIIPSSPVGMDLGIDPDQEGKGREGGSARASVAPLVVGPLKWDRIHGGHVTGFCDWVCFPSDLAEQFAGRAGWDVAAVSAWATAVRADWQANGRVPADRPYDFWNFRWQERHGSSRPAPVAAKKPDWKDEVRRRDAEREAGQR